jgi:acetyl esterase/lipase
MKKDYSKIHPQLQQSAKMFPNLTYSKLNVWLVNLLSRLMPASKPPQDVSIENVLIAGKYDKQKIRLRIYKPKSSNEAMPVLVWLHGGGYILGSPEQDDVSCIQYVREVGITVVSVDYRLAPKYPFPAGLEDCYTTLKWIVSHAQQLGIDDKRIAIGGGSAGAGLAASLAQYANDQNEIKIIFQLLIYPMLDDRTVLRTDIDDSNNITWNQKSNKFGWESYLGKKCGDENMPEYSVPARRKNLSGLPTTWIGVGTLDIFYDENMAYAQKLKEAGVPCETCVVSGAFHGFDVFDPQIPVVQEFRKSQITALKNAFGN